MFPAIHPAVNQLLVQSADRFFFVFGIIGLAVGVGLAVDRERMRQFFGYMNRWVSMRRSTRWLAIPRDSGPAVQRFRRPLGVTFILVAAYSTFVLFAQIDPDRVATVLHVNAPQIFVVWMIDSLRWFLIVGSLAAIVVGLLLIFVPNVLGAIEARSNRWYSARNRIHQSDNMNMVFDQWIESHPRATGWTIALGALAVVVAYGMRLFGLR